MCSFVGIECIMSSIRYTVKEWRGTRRKLRIDFYKKEKVKNDTEMNFVKENLIKVQFILWLNTY